MLQAFYNGLSGLLSFSKGLNNVSNNVSNMNTPGFRGSDTFFRSLNGVSGEGLGSNIAGTALRTKPGETKQTGNQTDLTINGSGFFVLKGEDGSLSYTRSGQFKFDSNNILVDTVTQKKVLALDGSGVLTELSIANQKSIPPTPTTKIQMTGMLVRSGATQPEHTISNVSIFNSSGSTQKLNFKFTPQPTPANSWLVSVSDTNGKVLQTGVIEFSPDGSPKAKGDKLTLALDVNGAKQNILIDFGEPGKFDLATQAATGASHTLSAKVVDGSAISGVVGYQFNDDGSIKFSYSNGETKNSDQKLALAGFADETVLIPDEKSLFIVPSSVKPQFAQAGTDYFGKIQGGALELSNVDLTQEFGDILIIQRGYQASSRVMTVANEMLQQLYGSTGGGQ